MTLKKLCASLVIAGASVSGLLADGLHPYRMVEVHFCNPPAYKGKAFNIQQGGSLCLQWSDRGDRTYAHVTGYSFAIRGSNKSADLSGNITGASGYLQVPSSWPPGQYVVRVNATRSVHDGKGVDSDQVYPFADTGTITVVKP